jgi:2-succinyl-6-hydroxy-2,4-cyclohexadiene-1-carboxylate synthase
MVLSHTVSGDLKGRPVIFIHGFLGCGAEWREVVAGCSDCQCICVDLPGHGGSSVMTRDSCSFEATANLLVDVLDQHEIESCNLVGYSMGGRVALYLALEQPDRVHSLFLEGAHPGLESPESRLERRRSDMLLVEKLHSDGLTKFVDSWLSMPMFESMSARPAEFEQLKAQRKRGEATGLAFALDGLGVANQPNLWDRLHELNMPVMIVAGENDSKFTRLSERMKNAVSTAKVTIVPHAGHNTHFEKPEYFVRILRDFLNRR